MIERDHPSLLFVGVFVALSLSSCTVPPSQASHPSETGGPGPLPLPSPWTATSLPTPSDVVPTPLPTGTGASDSPHETQQPAGPLTPSPSPTLKPLSAAGPWLVFCDRERRLVIQDETGDQASFPASGSCFEQTAVSAESRRLAFLTGGADGGNVLRILEAPGLEVVGEAALGDVEIRDVEQMSWSPDGAVLAYVASLEGQAAELHAYNVEQSTARLLDSRQGEILLMAWSPDSRWLVAFSGEGGVGLEEVWAASIDGAGTRVVFRHSSSSGTYYAGSVLGWTARSTFVMEDGPGEGCSYALREFNIETGGNRVLYDSSFGDPQLDPTSRTVFLEIREPGMCVYDLGPGIYRIPLAAPSPRLVVEGIGWERLFWLGPLGRLGVRTSSPPGIQTYAPDGRQEAFFADAAELFPSPDGAWALARTTDGGLALVDASGASHRMISSQRPEGIVWLTDSSAFYVLEDGGAIYHMAVEGQDRPSLVADSVLELLALLTP